MFDELLRVAANLNGSRIPIQMPLDNDGYLDRCCPAPNCGAHFKVLFEDWRTEKVRDEQVFCPICRADFPSGEWNTAEQQDYIKTVALRHMQETLGRAIQTDARRFNQRQPRGGFLSMSLSYKPGAPVFVYPIDAAEQLEQRFTCEQCHVRFATLGAGFFCPGCGHSSIIALFVTQLSALRKRIDLLPQLRTTISEACGKDEAQNTMRAILENAVGDLVSLFQHYAEGLYSQLPVGTRMNLPKNLFQRLNDGSAYWHKATGKSYEDLIGNPRLDELNRFFQQRHLIEHRGAVVDQSYLDKTGDISYSVGQRLVVREQDALELLDIVEHLGTAMLNCVNEANPRL